MAARRTREQAPGGKGAKREQRRRRPTRLPGRLHKDAVLDSVMTYLDDVFRQIELLTQRIPRMQAQLDVVTAKLRR